MFSLARHALLQLSVHPLPEQAERRVVLRKRADPMGAVRALSRRVVRLEHAAKPRRSPIVILYGSFDLFVEVAILPGIESGELDRADMIEIVAALRRWEEVGTWDTARR